MQLLPSFRALLQTLSPVMTAPSFGSFVTLLTGWLLARRHTVTGLIMAAQAVGAKHHSAFHRLFAAACWSRDDMGLAVFRLIQPWLGSTVMLAVDDTLTRKRGRKVFGAGMHHDPLLSSRRTTITNYGHSWVVLGVLVKLPLGTDRRVCLPFLFRLYLNKKSAAKHRRYYRTRPELAIRLPPCVLEISKFVIANFSRWVPPPSIAHTPEMSVAPDSVLVRPGTPEAVPKCKVTSA